MANIRERVDSTGVSTFQAQVRIKGYPPQSSSFPTKTLAKRWAQQIETEIRSGSIKTSAGGKRTVLEVLEHYEKEISPAKAKGGKDDAAPIRWWKQKIGHYFLNKVTPAIVGTAVSSLSSTPTNRGTPPAAATVLRYMMVLSHAFTVAVDELRWTETNPVKSMRRRPKAKNGRVRYLNDTERLALLRACRESTSTHLFIVVVLAMFTGMRRSEILGLQWKHITFFRTDSYAKAILGKTKNGDARSAMIAGGAYGLLLEKMEAAADDELERASSLLFPSPEKPNAPVDIRTPWENALKRSQITDFRFHDLRHTAASYLAQDGTSIQEIAAVLGHKSTRMAERYAHLTPERSDEVVRRMSSRISI